eukprot:gnl/TRDRNA2_/TRDRNA2_161398_c0_seq1.p1 gnl/TRDRNA2_/TRDRNA2_161398_c0~~gnl/TRDRNA2_/TRDRNA2_161398_c0_seq1.p1  ORF type:complete len:432 (-),score=120.03 gnl/TRDRNA2_/TRDRNA2_161398_c0_seq1:20-1192(-)
MAVPSLGGESITEGTIMEWRKNVGEAVAKGEIICMIETDKVTVEVAAEESGTIQEIFIKADENAEVGKPLIKMVTGAAPAGAAVAAPAAAAAAPAAAPAVAAVDPGALGLRAGFARAAAQRAGLTMPTAAAKAPSAASAAPQAAGTTAAPKKQKGRRTEQRVAMSKIRTRVTERMKETQNTAALLTTFQEVDMSAFMELRSKYKDQFEKAHGVGLGVMSIFVAASSHALREIPGVNAVIDDSTKEVVYRDYVDIAVPVATPRGPLIPVLRNVESMSILGVERTLNSFAARALRDEVAIDDMSGGTFGISDFGPYGGMLGTPIINPPQSAMLGLHEVKPRASVVNGKVVARPLMYIALSYDHRLVDGREAVTFLCSVRDKVEDPGRLLLEL